MLDNFGEFLKGHFTILSTAVRTTPLKNLGGVTRTLRIYGDSSDFLWNDTNAVGAKGDFGQVGKGTTGATRQDVNIETVFPDSPENAKQVSLAGGYNSGLGKITVQTDITPTGGAGAVTEFCKINNMNPQDTNTFEPFTLTRDIISPPASFIIGETISASLEVLI